MNIQWTNWYLFMAPPKYLHKETLGLVLETNSVKTLEKLAVALWSQFQDWRNQARNKKKDKFGSKLVKLLTFEIISRGTRRIRLLILMGSKCNNVMPEKSTRINKKGKTKSHTFFSYLEKFLNFAFFKILKVALYFENSFGEGFPFSATPISFWKVWF